VVSLAYPQIAKLISERKTRKKNGTDHFAVCKYVLCGPELRRVENGFVAIRGCRITDHGVLSSEVLAKYGHCPRVDCGELTLMPGLIDAHNHGTLDGHDWIAGAYVRAPGGHAGGRGGKCAP
jgi:imidazolonepropionase-like amidohydrolase